MIKITSIGHCCHDKNTDGTYSPGGTALYASLAAQALGAIAHVITSVGKDYLFKDIFVDNHIQVDYQESEKTTVFENIYTPQGRNQHLFAQADQIDDAFIIQSKFESDIVLLCPLIGEVSHLVQSQIGENVLIAATIQGWLRSVDKHNRIRPKSMDWSLLKGIEIVILSKEDIANIEGALDGLIKHIPLVILTNGAEGATIFHDSTSTHYPVFPIEEQDATGAGDVFSVAFLLKYYETKNLAKACIFAHAAASFIVEGNHISNLPTINKIQERIDSKKRL